MPLDEELNPRLAAVDAASGRRDGGDLLEIRCEGAERALLACPVPSHEVSRLPASDDPRWREGVLVMRGPRATDRVLGLHRATLARWTEGAGPCLQRAVEARQRGARVWSLRGRELALDPAAPRLMGILNVTPDSFSDGGRWVQVEAAVRHGLALVEEGASVLDVGGESTRPGSDPVPADEELRRVLPVLRALRERSEVALSVDTTKAEVAEAALEAGAQIVNDTSAGEDDPRMLEVVAGLGAGYVAMHRRGLPRVMQDAPSYEDCVAEVARSLRRAAARATEAGIEPSSLALDPGIGFGKRLEDNLQLVARIGELRSLGSPLLLGASRKSFLGRLTGRERPEDRDAATQAVTAVAFGEGIEMLRVHDVAGARDLLAVLRALEAER